MLIDRMIGVLKLDVNTFEDIEHDQGAMSQAATVVLFVAILSGLGAAIGGGDGNFLTRFLGSLIMVFAGWIIWSAIAYFVGTSLFEGQADIGEMLRVVGFAFTPQLLGIIPLIGGFVGAIWTLVAVFIALRQGLDLDNTKAALTAIVGLVIYLILMALVNFVF